MHSISIATIARCSNFQREKFIGDFLSHQIMNIHPTIKSILGCTIIGLVIVSLYHLSFGKIQKQDESIAAQIQMKPQSPPEDPATFVAFLVARLESKNISCSDLNSIDEYACLIFQAGMSSAMSEKILKDPKSITIADISAYANSARFKIYYAIETMNIVSNLISSPRNSLFKWLLDDEFKKPGTDAKLCIDLGYGICGNQAATFLALAERVGIESRPIQFFYRRNGELHSHIAVEVNIDGWRYFDATWGAFWYEKEDDPAGSILSISEINSSETLFAAKNSAHTWATASTYFNNVFEYLIHDADIIVGYDSGEIRLTTKEPNNGQFELSHIPNYVGDNIDDGPFEGIRYIFEPLDGRRSYQFDISGVGGCTSGTSRICVKDSCSTIRSDDQTLTLTAENAQSIFIDSPDDNICYVVFNKISYQ